MEIPLLKKKWTDLNAGTKVSLITLLLSIIPTVIYFVPDDPTEILAKRGVNWSTKSFAEAFIRGDTKIIGLFMEAEMEPEILHKSASAILYGMQPTLENNPISILRKLMELDFNINSHLVDGRILNNLSNGTLPAIYEADNKPTGYSGYVGGKFAGTLLMWVVVHSTYRGATNDDLEIINFLIKNGAESETSLAYLEGSRSWLGDTAPFKGIYPIIEAAVKAVQQDSQE